MAATYLANGFALSLKSYYNDIVTSVPFAVITSASVSFALTIGTGI